MKDPTAKGPRPDRRIGGSVRPRKIQQSRAVADRGSSPQLSWSASFHFGARLPPVQAMKWVGLLEEIL